MQRRFRSGGLAAWSIRRPISVTMLAMAFVVLGFFSLDRLGIDLLPHLIYPEVRVRILDPGVPATIMEDRITRQLEEQLAITEDAISVQSSSREGRSEVDLSFPYGTDIDIALRDASTRLDRAKRFLPESIDPPIIYKRDPSQIPVLELAISSSEMESVALRDWVDYEFSNWFLNLPGVASTEVGGGNEREIHLLVDQERLASLGLSFEDVITAVRDENRESAGGRITVAGRELNTRAAGRFVSLEELAALPLARQSGNNISQAGTPSVAAQRIIRLRDVARVLDSHEDERLRIRLNTQPGIKLSIQKQPTANTVEVVDAVKQRLQWLHTQNLIPANVQVQSISDQSVYVRHSLNNATIAVISGAILAMLVVYLFLGDLRRTLIIGTAIPLAIFVTFILMALGDLTLNIMTLGGLALGVGMLVDNTIVMLENITRHQAMGEAKLEAPVNAAAEVNSAIVAATSTNLAAILPFLFIGGLVGLLFSEMIFTLSAAILASLAVALTLVPAYGARVQHNGAENNIPLASRMVNRLVHKLVKLYTVYLTYILQRPWLPLLVLILPLLLAMTYFVTERFKFLPSMDSGSVYVSIRGESGTQIDEMDTIVKHIEGILLKDENVSSVFTTTGGFVFGRTAVQRSNMSGITVQLKPMSQRDMTSNEWIDSFKPQVMKLGLVGYKVRMFVRSGIRGISLNRGDDDISIRIQGNDIETLGKLADQAVEKLKNIKGLRNLEHSYEDIQEEMLINIDRERAADLGIRVDDISKAIQVGLDGMIISDFIQGDRQYDIRLRMPRRDISSPDELANVAVGITQNRTIRLRDVANIQLALSPASIKRDNQRRIVEISASLGAGLSIDQALQKIDTHLQDLQLPSGYNLYDGGNRKNLQEGNSMFILLLLLALFLVFVVMAVQYESLRNPIVIMLGIPFTIIGVAIGMYLFQKPLTMPVWLGLIMLAGIVVNNAIVLIEQIEIEREKNLELEDAIITASQHRLRPIIMTALTTVAGMLPLALALGEGSEMLQPLAIVIVAGLSFATLVTLSLMPALYIIFASETDLKDRIRTLFRQTKRES